MNRTVLSLFLSIGLVGAAPGASDGSEMIKRLAWLSGSWGTEHDGRWTEEHWTDPRGGLMLGVNRSGNGAAARGFEYLRIEADGDGSVTYWAAPGGQPAVPFKLTDQTGQSATFENPDHDFPTRLRYRREGDILEASISGPDGAGKITWQWTRQ